MPKPPFLSAQQADTASRELKKLKELGDGKSYLGRQVLAWAKASPDDERIPEALYIAVKANGSYKYGCSGWEHDDETRNDAENLLLNRYGASPWATKLALEAEIK